MTSMSWHDVIAAAQQRWDASTLHLSAWQAGFPEALANVVTAWDLVPVRQFGDGVGVPVVEVRAAGRPAVVKFGDPAELNHQAAVMLADGGRSVAQVLRHDPDAAAMLLEMLGAPLGHLVAEPDDELDPLAEALQEFWRLPLEVGADNGSKAVGLLGILERQGAEFGQDWPAALTLATTWAQRLAVDERVEVVCHGDPHAANLLQHGDGWRFVDPDGFLGERAYDLGVVIRGNSDAVLVMEATAPGSAEAFIRNQAAHLARRTGVAAQRIWAWGFVERVTTGLFCRMLGHEDEGRTHLMAAEALAG